MERFFRLLLAVLLTSAAWGKGSVRIETEGLRGTTVQLFALKSPAKHPLLARSEVSENDNANLPLPRIQPGSLYLIRVYGGTLLTGISGASAKDTVANRGLLHALVTGRDLRRGGPIRVGAVSELLYERFAARLRSTPSPRRLIRQIDEEAAAILGRDIDGDGRIDHRDVLRFRLDRDREALRRAYRADAVLEAPYRGKAPLLQCRRELARTQGDFSQILSLAPSPGHLWALWYDGNLSDLAAADPMKPVAHFAGVFAADALRYDAASRKLFLFDIDDSRPKIRILDAHNPRRVPATVPGSADDLAILNGRYYLLEAKALRILDARTLQTIDRLPLPKGDDRRFVLDRRRSLLYLIGEGPLRVYRITKNGALRPIGSYPDLADCFELALYDGGKRALAIVDSGMEGVKVLDLSHPSAIHILHTLRYGGLARPPIQIAGDRALIEWDSHLALLDLRKRDRPPVLGWLASPMRPDSLNAPRYALMDDGREAWVAGDAGLLRYDTTLYSSLFTLGRIPFSGPDRIRIDPKTRRLYLSNAIGDTYELVVLGLEKGKLRLLSRFPDYDEKRGPYFDSMIFALLDHDRAVAANAQGEVYLLDLRRSRVRSIGHLEAVEKAFDSQIESLLPIEGGTCLLVGSDQGRVALFATPRGKKTHLLTSLSLAGSVRKLVPLTSRRFLALVAGSGVVAIDRSPSRELTAQRILLAPDAVDLLVDPRYAHLYLTRENGTLERYRLEAQGLKRLDEIPNAACAWATPALSPDGKFLFVGKEGELGVYDRRTLHPLGSYPIVGLTDIVPLLRGKRALVVGENALLSLDLSLLFQDRKENR
ncbi:hypothetical protein [Nitratifractor sp.]